MNAQQPQKSTSWQRRFSKGHIIALGIVSLITLILISWIAWILLTQNVTQVSLLIGLVASIVTIVIGLISVYIWIIESSKKSGEQQHGAHPQHQQISESQPLPSTIPDPPSTPETSMLISNGLPIQTQTLAQMSADTPATLVDRLQAKAANEGNGADAQTGEVSFQVGNPLSKDTVTYIERQADQDALRHLRKMEYIVLIDPRQQGKTSLIFHLMQRLSKQKYTFVIFDLSEPKYQNKSEEEWYKALGTSFLQDLDFLQSGTHPPLPTDSMSWELFLRNIAEASSQAKQRTVIILDEISEIFSSYATPFFTVIRMVFNQRPLHPHYEYLTFIISGVFNPDELIRDEQVSKFIAQRISLDDFDLAQVKQLVKHLSLPDELNDVVARCIYRWTEGQPYLTQKVCRLLSSQVLPPTHQELSGLVDRLGRQLYNDQLYLGRIKWLREKEPKLLEYAQGIAFGNRPYFSSGLSEAHFRLAYIYGVIKADREGYCRIRNHICEHALMRIITHPL